MPDGRRHNSEKRCKVTHYFSNHQTFQKKNVTLASPKVLSLENAQIYLAFYSLVRTFNYVEIRLHLGNIQINLVFHSICTNFAPKIYNYGDKESRIHPKRPDGVDVSG